MDGEPIPGTVVLESAPLAKLACALAKAQGAFGVPTKGHEAVIKSTKGEYRYRYSTLDDLIDATRPSLTANGLAVLQDVEVSPRAVSVWTVILHESGEQWRSKPVILAVGGDQRPQDVGSAITYARRYSMGAALNVAADEDDDAQAAQRADKPKAQQQKPREQAKPPSAPAEPAHITPEQKRELVDLAKSLDWHKDDYFRLLAKYGAESTDGLPADKFIEFKHALETGAEVPA